MDEVDAAACWEGEARGSGVYGGVFGDGGRSFSLLATWEGRYADEG